MFSPANTDLLDRLLDSVPAPVLVADLRGRVTRINAAAEIALGYRLEETPELTVGDVYHRADDARRVLTRLNSRVGTDRTLDPFDVTLRARNGELVPVRLTAALVRDAAGEPVATIGVFQDRREQLAIERRLEEAAVHIEAAEVRAAGMTSVATVVHEIAQPLTAAMGLVEMLMLDDDLREEQRTRLDRTYEQLDRIRGLITTLARPLRRVREGEGTR
jgi:PAS domain S-box-containing protein